MSQAFMKSTENDFLVAQSKNGTHELNEVGITINTQINPKFRVGLQLLSRDFGNAGNNHTQLDWGFADYRFKDYLGFRFGKVKLPFGLYNEGRDTDVLRPMAFLPQSIYDEQYRPYLLAYQGTGLYGDIVMGGMGSLEYHVYTGSMNLDKDEIVMKVTNDVATKVIKQGIIGSTIQTLMGMGMTYDTAYATAISAVHFDGFAYTEAKCTGLYGGTLFWNTPLQGLKTGASFAKVDLEFYSPTATATIAVPGAPVQTKTFTHKRDGGIPLRLGLSGEWQWNYLTLASEYAKTTLKQDHYDDATGNKIAEFERDDVNYYLMASYMIFDKYTFSLLYDKVDFSRMEVKSGSVTTDLLPSEDYLKQRTDIGIAGRYDVNYNWTLKAEFHMMDGYAKVYSEYLDPNNNIASDAKDKWNYFLVKASYNF